MDREEFDAKTHPHLTKEAFNSYSSPSPTSRVGSAYHDWTKCGAIWAYENPNGNAEKAAKIFAGAITSHASPKINSMFKAFMEGARGKDKLVIKGKDNGM